MVTIIACWDHQTTQGEIHLVLEHSECSPEERLERSNSRVIELEALLDPDRYEVILAVSRSLQEFCQTDPRFLK